MTGKLILFITIIFLAGNHSYSQINYSKSFLDSIYTEYVNLKQVLTSKDYNKPLGIKTENTKCGLFVINWVKQNINLFSPQQQQLLKTLSGRPSLPLSIISPSGKFRIHYDTTAMEKPKYNTSMSIEENLSMVSTAIDSSYNFEVNYLGYPPPPSDNGAGGDNLYDIYIVNLGGGFYGYTEWENKTGATNWTSFMVIDNDYVGYYSSGINGAKVTLAHEFHHGIQLGSYALENSNSPVRDGDTFFYEITSTAMEEFVYDDVNDYYAYMSSYFLSPQRAFAENDGYNLAIWNIYLKDVFGFGLLKRQWEILPTQRAMNAINLSLSEKSTSFKHELNNFGIWTYHTKYRAIPGKYFEEASKYPLVRPLSTIAFTSPNEIITINSKPTANNFIRFTNQANNNDTLYVLITNGDVQGAVNNLSQTDSIAYYLYDYPESGASKIDSNYYSKFTTANPFFWSVSEISDTVINVVEPQQKTDYPYPMPFSYNKYSEDTPIKIPVNSDNSNNIGLYIFNISMELVYSNEDMSRASDNKNVVSWKVKDNQGRKLASGVYIYVIKDGDNVQKGKLVILHD